MARKHNTRHDRAPSRYPERLRNRGVSSPRMMFIDARGRSFDTADELHRHGAKSADPKRPITSVLDDLTDLNVGEVA